MHTVHPRWGFVGTAPEHGFEVGVFMESRRHRSALYTLAFFSHKEGL
jgi:hypothetical protein